MLDKLFKKGKEKSGENPQKPQSYNPVTRKLKIPTILGIGVLVSGLVAGVFLVQRQQTVRTEAGGESAPKDVRVTNVTDSSFTVSWTTDRFNSGFVVWGDSQSSLNQTESNSVEGNSNVHYVTIRNLSPSQTYYFKINSGGEDFDNNGIPWKVDTGPALGQAPSVEPISGRVLNSDGTPASNSIVTVTIAGGTPLSTLTSREGNWVIPLSQARNQSLSSYAQIDESNTLIQIFAQGSGQVASAQIYPESARPVPPILLGETHDFKNTTDGDKLTQPESDIGLPDEATQESKINLSGEDVIERNQNKVTVDNLDDGEVVTSTNPEFFGQGPSGESITISVESEHQSGEVNVDSQGNWSWSPPEDLEEGTHTLKVSWTDEDGILRTITRTFIVQASEGDPSFESTPSATPTSTPSSTSTPTPTSSPSATPTISPATSPTETASPSSLPDAGILTPTLVISIMGIGSLAFSGMVACLLAFEKRHDKRR